MLSDGPFSRVMAGTHLHNFYHVMSSLVNLNSTPSFQYDWSSIGDRQAATAARSAVDSYSVQFHALKEQASKLLETNTLALSKCVLVLKESLQRGEFDSVCEQALKLSRTKAWSLAAVGLALQRGELPSEALQLLNQMEPQAAAKLVKQPDEVIRTYVRTNEQTGKVPSQRDFSTPKPKVEQYASEAPSPTLEPTQNKWEAKDRFVSNKIRLGDAVGAVALMLAEQKTASEKSVDVLTELKAELDRLLKVSV